MFSAVGGFVGRLFGSKEAGNQLIDSVASGIDKIFYTDQEEAEAKAKAKTEAMTVYMGWLESTTGSRLARRMLALGVSGIWGLEHLTSVILSVASIFADDSGAVTAAKLTEASDKLAGHALDNNALVGIVLLFYFGGPAAIDGVKGLVMKWTNKGAA
jgi:hypothetical protein